MKQADMPAMALSGDAYTDFAAYNPNRNDSSYNPECLGLTKRQHAELEILKSLCINKRETQLMKHLVEDAQKLAGLLIESWESENQ